MSFLDALIFGVRECYALSVRLARRSKINFGDGLTATDDPVNGWTNVTADAGGSLAVIVDGGSASQNVRTNRPNNQSAIVNTQDGIVNLGSDTSGVAPGAFQGYATIGGGDGNSANAYGTVPGGYACQAGTAGFASGDTCVAGTVAVAVGSNCLAEGGGSVALGDHCHAASPFSVSLGGYSTASRVAQLALGTGRAGAQSSVYQLSFFAGAPSTQTSDLRDTGTNEFALEDGHAYQIQASIVAYEATGPGRYAARRRLVVGCEAGIAVLDTNSADGPESATGTGALWTSSFSVSGSDNILKCTFDPTAGPAGLSIYVNARLDIVEISP